MTPRKKDRRKHPETITPVTDENDASLEMEEESCSESCSKSGISRNNDNATC
jgi:hypothetical protein